MFLDHLQNQCIRYVLVFFQSCFRYKLQPKSLYFLYADYFLPTAMRCNFLLKRTIYSLRRYFSNTTNGVFCYLISTSLSPLKNSIYFENRLLHFAYIFSKTFLQHFPERPLTLVLQNYHGFRIQVFSTKLIQLIPCATPTLTNQPNLNMRQQELLIILQLKKIFCLYSFL